MQQSSLRALFLYRCCQNITNKVKKIADDLEYSTLKNIENYFNLINVFISKIPSKINFRYSLEFLENINFSFNNYVYRRRERDLQ